MEWWQVGGDRGGLLVLTGHVYVCAMSLSLFRLCVTPWTVAHQAPLSM